MSEQIYQTVQVSCPSCQAPFSTPVLTIIDTSQNPEGKVLFLSGRLNVAVCPQCGSAGALATPLVFHDPEKELLYTFVPSEMGLPEAEQQRIIGDLTNRVMSSLPPEERKGYLLRPQSFLRLEAMANAILQADGVTPEMMEAQQAKTALLSQLAQTPDEATRRALVEENDEKIDGEFIQLLTINIEMALTDGSEEVAQELQRLLQQLFEWTTAGKEVAARDAAIQEMGTEISREALLAKLIEAALAGETTRVETLIALGRPAIDYVFYQQLTERVDAAAAAGNTAEAETLKALRETSLDLTAQVDAQMEEATSEAAKFLQDLVESDDPEALVRAQSDQIGDLLLGVLGANLKTAEEEGRQDDVDKLNAVGDAIMKVVQESQPPEVRFISELLSAEYPEGTKALLEANKEQIDERLLQYMQLIGEDLANSGQEGGAARLNEIQEMAQALMPEA